MEEQPPSSGGASMTPAPKSRRTLWAVLAVIVIVVVLLVAAVLAGLFNPAKPTTALKIGTLLSMTGALNQYGPGDTKGVQLAVEQINAAGGVLGQPVQLVIEDDQTSTVAAAAATTKLITQNHVDAIVGAQFSGGTIASISIAKTAGVPMVSPSATSPALSNQTLTGGYFFRTAPSDALQGVVAGNYLYGNMSYRYLNIIADNNPYGTGLAGVTKARFMALGGTVNTTQIIDPAATDFTADITALFSTNPQAVYFISYPTEALTLMTQWQAGLSSHPSWNRPWYFSEGLRSQAFMDQLRQASVGVDVTKIHGTAPVSPFGALEDAFVNQYEARFSNQTPVQYADYAYDCAYLIALAAQKAGSVNGTAIRNTLRAVSGPNGTVIQPGQWAKAVSEIAAGHAVNWEGAAGSENFDSNGDVRGSYEVWGVNSTFQLVRVAFIPDSIITTSSLSLQSLAQPVAGQSVGLLFLKAQITGIGRQF